MSANIDRILDISTLLENGPTIEDCYHGGRPLVDSQIPAAMVSIPFFIYHQ